MLGINLSVSMFAVGIRLFYAPYFHTGVARIEEPSPWKVLFDDALSFVTNTTTSVHSGYTKSVMESQLCIHDALPEGSSPYGEDVSTFRALLVLGVIKLPVFYTEGDFPPSPTRRGSFAYPIDRSFS